MSRITDEHLAELERVHGRIKHVTYNGIDLVFRKPKRPECQAYIAKAQGDNPSEKAAADDQLAQLLVVQVGDLSSPIAEVKRAFLNLLEDYPLAARNAAVGGALAKLTGAVQDENAKTYGSGSKGNANPLPSSPTG